MTCRCEPRSPAGLPRTEPEGWEPVLSLGAGRERDSEAGKRDKYRTHEQPVTVAGTGFVPSGDAGEAAACASEGQETGYCQNSHPGQPDPRIESTFLLNVGIPFRMCA